MAATGAPVVFGSSTDGRPIKVTPTAIGSAETLHTGSSTATEYDEIDVYAVNTGANPETLYLCVGGVTDPDDKVPVPLAAGAGPKFCGRYRLKGNATPLILKAFASTADVINVWGQVTRYTP